MHVHSNDRMSLNFRTDKTMVILKLVVGWEGNVFFAELLGYFIISEVSGTALTLNEFT